MHLYDNYKMALGERLKEARKLRKMSQVALAKESGVSQGLISDIENNAYPTSAYVPKFADILNVSAIWLADGKGDKYSQENNKRELSQNQATYEVSPAMLVAGIEIKSNEAILLEHYRKLSSTSKEILDMTLNRLYELEHPEDSRARADGTYVSGHFRTDSNDTKLDNYSTRGNVNPYTGNAGTVQPYQYNNNQYNPRNSNIQQPRNNNGW